MGKLSPEQRITRYAVTHTKAETELYSRKIRTQAEYKSAAHRLNQRMSAIEKAVSKGNVSEAILKHGYALGQDVAKSYGMVAKNGKGLRVPESIPLDHLNTMNKRLHEISNILDMPSSSLQNWKDAYGRGVATTNYRYGTDIDEEDLSMLWEDGAGEFFKDKIKAGSKTVMVVVGNIQAKSKEIKEYFKKQRKSHHKIDLNRLADIIGTADGYDIHKDISEMSKSDQKHFRQYLEAVANM